MKTTQTNSHVKTPLKAVKRCLVADVSPPEYFVVKELKNMLRCPELFLAGCTCAEPTSASFWQNKYSNNVRLNHLTSPLLFSVMYIIITSTPEELT